MGLFGALGEAARAAESHRVPVGVLPIRAINVDVSERDRLSQVLVEQLRRSGTFIVRSSADAGVVQEGCVQQPGCLKKLGQRLRVEQLVELRVGRLGSTFVVRLILFSAAAGTRLGSWQEVQSTLAPKPLAATLNRMIAGFAPRPAVVEKRPWYRRWWVWTAAGAVVAGTITTALLLSQSSGNGADVIIRPP